MTLGPVVLLIVNLCVMVPIYLLPAIANIVVVSSLCVFVDCERKKCCSGGGGGGANTNQKEWFRYAAIRSDRLIGDSLPNA